MAITRFPKVPQHIVDFFRGHFKKIFTLQELAEILDEQRLSWHLPAATVEDFEKQLVQWGILQANKFEFEGQSKSKIRFFTHSADIYDIALTLIPRAYLSHQTALAFHGIIDAQHVPVYVTSEQSKKHIQTQTQQLEQGKVDEAFSKPQRKTSNRCSFRGREIIALNGMFTSEAGVTNVSGKRVTSLERTLIDVAVRPNYAGGTQQVLNAFVSRKGMIDMPTLIQLLDAIDYAYPYYQSIGFYLEFAGYNTDILSLREREKFIDFHLDYEMKNPAYSKQWRLFYPRDFER